MSVSVAGQRLRDKRKFPQPTHHTYHKLIGEKQPAKDKLDGDKGQHGSEEELWDVCQNGKGQHKHCQLKNDDNDADSPCSDARAHGEQRLTENVAPGKATRAAGNEV